MTQTPPERPQRKSGPLPFRPVTKNDFFEEIPLRGRPEFKGGIFESDHPKPAEEITTPKPI